MVDRDLLGLLEQEEDLESGKEVKTKLQGSLDSLLGEILPTGLPLYVYLSRVVRYRLRT